MRNGRLYGIWNLRVNTNLAKCVPDEYEMEVQMLIEQSEEETTD